MPFNIVERLDLSLFDLMQIHMDGGAVVKTPHVGNWYLNNLGIASLGIRMGVLDRTIGEKDHNFHPNHVIVDGQAERIANPAIMITHATVERAPTRMADRFPVGARVLDCHMQALRDAVPGVECEIYTDFLRKHRDRVLEILRVIVAHSLHHWNRVVSKNGVVINGRTCRGWRDLEEWGIYGLTNDESGWLTPNVVNIMLDGVLDAVNHDTTEVYHMSGPDMNGYIDMLSEDLRRLHAVASHKVGWVPGEITFNLIPVAGMRFAIAGNRRYALDELVDALRTLLDWRRSHGEEIPPRNGANKRLRKLAKTPEYKAVKKQYLWRLRTAIAECPDIFYDITDGTFVSQYDLLEAGCGVYVPDWALEQSMDMIKYLNQYLNGVMSSMAESRKAV